jgi:hypothetical protein
MKSLVPEVRGNQHVPPNDRSLVETSRALSRQSTTLSREDVSYRHVMKVQIHLFGASGIPWSIGDLGTDRSGTCDGRTEGPGPFSLIPG